jgi:hypothetical protein
LACLPGRATAIWAGHWGHRLAARTKRQELRDGLDVVATGVTGTVEVLRQKSWRVLGTWVDLFGAIGAFWPCQFAQAIPVPGGVGAIDAGVTGALVLYGGGTEVSAGGEIIWHDSH